MRGVRNTETNEKVALKLRYVGLVTFSPQSSNGLVESSLW